MSKLNYKAICRLQNHVWQDGAYINNDYTNVTNSGKKRLEKDLSRIETKNRKKIHKT